MVDEGACFFRVLGPVQVEVAGRPVALPRRQHLDLLGFLLVHHERVVTVEQLTDAMWGEAVPRSAYRQLTNMLSALRKALRIDNQLLATVERQAAGYRLCVCTGRLDLAEFTALVAKAKAATEPTEAIRLWRSALAWWNGDHALAGVRAPFADLVRAHLHEQRNAVREALFDAELRIGNHSGIVAELTDAVAADPTRERLVAHLMTALHRCGRTVEALAVFRRVRQTLIDDYGLEPGAHLCDLERRILAGDTSLAPVSPQPAIESDRPALTPAQLPRDVRGFVGRKVELAALTEWTANSPAEPVVCVVMGTAGVGKTTLAVHWAHRVSERFPDGQLYLDLRGFGPDGPAMTAAEAIRVLLDAFAVPAERIPATLDAQAALYRTLMAGRRMLVLLDNARDTAQVTPLLPGTPGSAVIVTSRNHLTGLIATQGAFPLTLDVLDEAAARQLFVARLGRQRVAAEEEAVAGIARLCARLPLALSLAAARAASHPAFSLQALCEDLSEAYHGLQALASDDSTVDVSSVFSWSYRQVGRPAATLFRLLGGHPGPDVTVAAAASLAGWSQSETATRLRELAHAHLVTEHVPGRFTMHDLLREYAASRPESDHHEREAALVRVLDHYLHAAYAAALVLYPHRYPLVLPDPRPGVVDVAFDTHDRAWRWFGAERRGLVAAVECAAQQGLVRHAWQLASAVSTYLSRSGHWQDWVTVQRLAVQATSRVGDAAGEAHAQCSLGLAYNRLGDYERAHHHLDRSFALLRQLADPIGEGYAHLCASAVWEKQGDNETALTHAKAAYESYRRAGYRVGQALSANSTGWLQAQVGNYSEAVRSCERAVALHRELGDRQGAAQALDSLGYARHRMGEHQEAVAAYELAIAELHAAGNHYHQAIPLMHLGQAHQAAGQVESARDAWRQALAILDELGSPDTKKVRQWLRRLDEPPADT